MEAHDSLRRACNLGGALRHPAISDQGLTAIVRFSGGRLQLVRHPADGLVVAFDDADAAFCFAVSLELADGESAGTVAAPAGVAFHVLAAGTAASEIATHMEAAAA